MLCTWGYHNTDSAARSPACSRQLLLSPVDSRRARSRPFTPFLPCPLADGAEFVFYDEFVLEALTNAISVESGEDDGGGECDDEPPADPHVHLPGEL